MNLIQKNLEKLRDELHQHNYYYYVLDKPLISDFDFDMKLKQLNDLENKFPEFNDDNSPTKRVGGVVVKSFNSIIHKYPMYSLDNSYSKEDLEDWNQRLNKNLEVTDFKFLCELNLMGFQLT